MGQAFDQMKREVLTASHRSFAAGYLKKSLAFSQKQSDALAAMRNSTREEAGRDTYGAIGNKIQRTTDLGTESSPSKSGLTSHLGEGTTY